MKLGDLLGNIVENKKNGQHNANIKKKTLKKMGISIKDICDLDIDLKIKKLMENK